MSIGFSLCASLETVKLRGRCCFNFYIYTKKPPRKLRRQQRYTYNSKLINITTKEYSVFTWLWKPRICEFNQLWTILIKPSQVCFNYCNKLYWVSLIDTRSFHLVSIKGGNLVSWRWYKPCFRVWKFNWRKQILVLKDERWCFGRKPVLYLNMIVSTNAIKYIMNK